ncbi:hypothetical protein GFS60_08230 (plasmid) [Rhodococcus sp. WAY2]|uniref:helix-turn-helix domain-containing protein n=1 Tax=Rhodococcus sp. UFZ-B548 TaxID=2742212 RepID=UPI0013200364|nr:helix-turn-helix transcriptional regulator [Rhodococcus sp. UFZ-B548]QHE74526.1 hypothetical protein GFS60_08230 [Rhodococcus sp. WAY2]
MTGALTPVDAERFSQVLRARRRVLGLSLAAVAEAGGPAEPTMVRLESGAGGPIRVSTLAKLDKVLRWQVGGAMAAITGDQPIPLEHDSTESSHPVGELPISDAEVVQLCELVGDLNRMLHARGATRRAALDASITRFEEILEPIMVRAARVNPTEDSEVLNRVLAEWVILRGTR